jgi:hypothetical protein
MKTEFEIKTQFEELKKFAEIDNDAKPFIVGAGELVIELLLDIRLLAQLLVSGLIQRGGQK